MRVGYIQTAGNAIMLDQIVQQQEEITQLRAELEQTRVQLAGCGVAAKQNTEKSRTFRVLQDSYGWSASYADVCDAVDREIELRAERDMYKEALEEISKLFPKLNERHLVLARGISRRALEATNDTTDL